jgi:hypothetical protein
MAPWSVSRSKRPSQSRCLGASASEGTSGSESCCRSGGCQRAVLARLVVCVAVTLAEWLGRSFPGSTWPGGGPGQALPPVALPLKFAPSKPVAPSPNFACAVFVQRVCVQEWKFRMRCSGPVKRLGEERLTHNPRMICGVAHTWLQWRPCLRSTLLAARLLRRVQVVIMRGTWLRT